ncbi:hypothetical protein KDK_15690 [Dictyobacter kobayashii]|uniref:Uncharacterized protein n=1 Tax=Dictyobacter kobayashii TaxID=2014872 RepID=A0A402AF93_9CHLR|nr:hypothetical protein KDK_15690 [Dictyobacter kobayashii]
MVTDASDTNVKNSSFTKKYGNVITVALWVAALSSHAILIPKLVREFKH